MRYGLYAMSEYVNLITLSALCVTLFLGGWHGPMFHLLPWLWPTLWFVVKLFVVIYALVWVRATLPRFRYDRLMAFGWKVLIPSGLLWILITAAAIVLPARMGNVRAAIVILSSTVLALIVLWPLFVGPPRHAQDGGAATTSRRARARARAEATA
jgi:NADH-quinone oxidoreductase subunit H